MLKRILKSLMWTLLSSEVPRRINRYREIHNKNPSLSQIGQWKKESYRDYMKDPDWWRGIQHKDIGIMAVLIVALTAICLFMFNY